MLPSGRNPFEIVLIAAGLLAGLTGVFVPGAGSPTIHTVLPGYEPLWNLGLVIGAGTAAVALVLSQPMTVLVERVGMIWLAALFVPYGAAVLILSGPVGVTGGVTIVGYGLACAARVVQITVHRRGLHRAARDVS